MKSFPARAQSDRLLPSRNRSGESMALKTGEAMHKATDATLRRWTAGALWDVCLFFSASEDGDGGKTSRIRSALA